MENSNYQAVKSLVAGLAPNLQTLDITYPWWVPDPYDFEETQSWKCLIPSKQTTSSSIESGSLRFLEIFTDYDIISRQIIENWKAQTDFSYLETLKLDLITQDALECLVESSGFRSLRELSLVLERDESDESEDRRRHPQTDEFYHIADHLLCSLPPLSSLSLTGGLHRLGMKGVLENHGRALCQLYLMPLLRDRRLLPEDIIQIGVHCPLLEDLHLTLHRSRGDATEVATYKALGSIAKLQYLSLELDASSPDIECEDDDAEWPEAPNDPSFDDFDQQFFVAARQYSRGPGPRNGHVRDAFINNAMDESLASAIFWAILSGKAAGSLPLEKLRIELKGGGDFGQGLWCSITDIIRNLSRSWFCVRSPRDDSRHKLMTEKQERSLEFDSPYYGAPVVQLRPNTETIFRRLWPATQRTGSDWRDDWRSLPLYGFDTQKATPPYFVNGTLIRHSDA